MRGQLGRIIATFLQHFDAVVPLEHETIRANF
jgi:hypothetical protein